MLSHMQRPKHSYSMKKLTTNSFRGAISTQSLLISDRSELFDFLSKFLQKTWRKMSDLSITHAYIRELSLCAGVPNAEGFGLTHFRMNLKYKLYRSGGTRHNSADSLIKPRYIKVAIRFSFSYMIT